MSNLMGSLCIHSICIYGVPTTCQDLCKLLPPCSAFVLKIKGVGEGREEKKRFSLISECDYFVFLSFSLSLLSSLPSPHSKGKSQIPTRTFRNHPPTHTHKFINTLQHARCSQFAMWEPTSCHQGVLCPHVSASQSALPLYPLQQKFPFVASPRMASASLAPRWYFVECEWDWTDRGQPEWGSWFIEKHVLLGGTESFGSQRVWAPGRWQQPGSPGLWPRHSPTQRLVPLVGHVAGITAVSSNVTSLGRCGRKQL